jgi:hypothetical protein
MGTRQAFYHAEKELGTNPETIRIIEPGPVQNIPFQSSPFNRDLQRLADTSRHAPKKTSLQSGQKL